MRMVTNVWAFAGLGLLLTVSAGADAQTYRLRTSFTGAGKCLDIVNDGANDKLIMAACGNYSGQSWRIEPTERRGYVRLKTDFTGDARCLDVINDGTNDKVHMAKCGNYSGQYWSEPISDTFKLKNTFTGAQRCLDIVNDGKNSQLTLAACGNYSGQLWTRERQ